MMAAQSTPHIQDATTNPSLLLAAANKPAYARLLQNAIDYAKEKGGDLDTQAELATDRLVRWRCFLLLFLLR